MLITHKFPYCIVDALRRPVVNFNTVLEVGFVKPAGDHAVTLSYELTCHATYINFCASLGSSPEISSRKSLEQL